MRRLETNSKLWREMRDELLKKAQRVTPEVSSVKNHTPDFVLIEGASIGYKYDFKNWTIRIWAKGRRHSGREFEIREITNMSIECRAWHMELLRKLGESHDA